MSVEQGVFRQKVEEGSTSRKIWEKFKKMVAYVPAIIGGILGFAVGEKAAKH